MKGSTTRYRIRERYWTVDEIATEAWHDPRWRMGAHQSWLERRGAASAHPGQATTRAERAIRRKLKAMVRQIQAHLSELRICFDMFQPAHMLRTIKPG